MRGELTVPMKSTQRRSLIDLEMKIQSQETSVFKQVNAPAMLQPNPTGRVI